MYDRADQYKSGSIEEAVIMSVVDRMRVAELMAPLLAASSPENRHKLFKEFQGVIFPENADSDVKMIAKGRALLEKLRNVDFTIRPI